MSQKIVTFSISEHDKAHMELIQSIKDDCAKTGRTFTHVVLSALKEYKEKLDEPRRK